MRKAAVGVPGSHHVFWCGRWVLGAGEGGDGQPPASADNHVSSRHAGEGAEGKMGDG